MMEGKGWVNGNLYWKAQCVINGKACRLMVLDNTYTMDTYMGIHPKIDSATRPFPKFDRLHGAQIL